MKNNPSIAQEWKLFCNALPGMTTDELADFKRAFYSGAMGMRRMIRYNATLPPGKRKKFATIVHNELRDFINNEMAALTRIRQTLAKA